MTVSILVISILVAKIVQIEEETKNFCYDYQNLFFDAIGISKKMAVSLPLLITLAVPMCQLWLSEGVGTVVAFLFLNLN